MKKIKGWFRALAHFPSAIMGLAIILFLLGVAAYALITIPYSEAVRLWRGGEDVWYKNPKYAAPSWYNFFTTKKLPLSFAVDTADGSMSKTVTSNDPNISTVDITYSFDYTYDGFPDQIPGIEILEVLHFRYTSLLHKIQSLHKIFPVLTEKYACFIKALSPVTHAYRKSNVSMVITRRRIKKGRKFRSVPDLCAFTFA